MRVHSSANVVSEGKIKFPHMSAFKYCMTYRFSLLLFLLSFLFFIIPLQLFILFYILDFTLCLALPWLVIYPLFRILQSLKKVYVRNPYVSVANT
ncbi:hypothetical protein BC941DRAFT_442385, partial [Chlamydoabsidia padenii]